jgi:putative ABC transport system permease protein
LTGWLLIRGLRRAPRRALLGAVGVAFPVAVLAATLFFVDTAVRSMTRLALDPVQVEMRAISTSLDTNLSQVGSQLASVPGVRRVERFASADVVVSATGRGNRSTARLFAVDPAYLSRHHWVRVVTGGLAGGALLSQTLRAVPGVGTAQSVTIQLPGRSGTLLKLRPSGTVDLRQAFTWFSIPAGEVQGDIAMVPRAIVIDYATFDRAILPALRAELGTATTALNPGLANLPPVTLEEHIAVDHGAYPSDPARAVSFSSALRRVLERRESGSLVVADNAAEELTMAAADATNARILFLLLGLPGVLVAAVLGLATESALAEAQRREEALLRLRGATDGQVVRLAAAHAAVAGALGAAIGLVIAAIAVSAANGQLLWEHTSVGRLAFSAALAVLVGATVTAVRLIRLRRAGRRTEVVSERVLLKRGWSPAWRRGHLDLVMIAVGVVILLINGLGGGLKQAPIGSPTLALSFYVLLAPIALWLGLTLLAIRLLLAALGRSAGVDRIHPLSSWRAACLRWIARRPARMVVALALGSLAVAYGTEVVAFAATYRTARSADHRAAFGSDLRLTPATEAPVLLPSHLPKVAATTPIHFIPARVGSDRKTILAVDPSSYRQGTTAAPQLLFGRGLDALAHDPHSVLVADEIAKDFVLKPGDTLPLTVYPDDQERSRPVKFTVAGSFRSFPPTFPASELVINQAAFPAFLLGQPDFYLARVVSGTGADQVAAELRRAGIERGFAVTTQADQRRFGQPNLAALNLGPLSDIESVAAALIAAIGVAVLGAFIVLERRREFAILRAVGADTAQVVSGPAQEGLVTVIGSIVIGIVVGLGLSIVAVRVLGLLFTLPPPLLTVPVGTLLVFCVVMLAAAGAALGAALLGVTRVAAATVLREP